MKVKRVIEIKTEDYLEEHTMFYLPGYLEDEIIITVKKFESIGN